MIGKNFSIEQKTLLSLLTSMQPICSKRTTLDVTEFILFQINSRELILKATDLEISLQASVSLESNEIENQNFLVSGKRIFELVKELENTINFSIENNQLTLRSGGVDLALNIRDSEDFPPFPERIENLMQLEGAFLLNLLNKVAFLIPQNNSNPALNGMLLEFSPQGMSMVATDGHCLAKVYSSKLSLKESKQWLLPKRAVLELKKLLETNDSDSVFLGICGNQLVFSGSYFNFFTKLLADPFPQYSAILNKDGFKAAKVVKNDILKTLKRANCLLAGHFVSTKFSFKPGKLDVSLKNKEVGKLEESLLLNSFDGDIIESRFYSPYLLNGLAAFSEKDLNLFIKNSIKPIIFESEQNDHSFTFLVMPVSMAQQ